MAKNTTKNAPKKRGRPRKAEPKPAPLRKSYADDVKGEAKDLYQRGVTLERIGRYLGVPLRTLTNWQTENDWTDGREPESAAVALRRRGFAVADIAARLSVSERSVRNWLKAAGFVFERGAARPPKFSDPVPRRKTP